MAWRQSREALMNYQKVARTSDFTSTNKKKVSWNGLEILLTKIQGTYYAVDNTCTHMGGSLYDGKLEGNQVICPRHGSVYDATTGKVVQRGKLFTIKVKVHDLHHYPLKVEGTDILIGIG